MRILENNYLFLLLNGTNMTVLNFMNYLSKQKEDFDLVFFLPYYYCVMLFGTFAIILKSYKIVQFYKIICYLAAVYFAIQAIFHFPVRQTIRFAMKIILNTDLVAESINVSDLIKLFLSIIQILINGYYINHLDRLFEKPRDLVFVIINFSSLILFSFAINISQIYFLALFPLINFFGLCVVANENKELLKIYRAICCFLGILFLTLDIIYLNLFFSSLYSCIQFIGPSGMLDALSFLYVMIYVAFTIQMLTNIYSFKHASQILKEISEKKIGNIKQLQSLEQDQEENHQEIYQKSEQNQLTNQFIQKYENQHINYYEQVSE